MILSPSKTAKAVVEYLQRQYAEDIDVETVTKDLTKLFARIEKEVLLESSKEEPLC